MSRVLVVGAGMAGTAATVAARAAGAEVTVVAPGPGATAFCRGVAWATERVLPEGWAIPRVLPEHAPHPSFPLAEELFARTPEGSWLSTVLGELVWAPWAMPQQALGAIRSGARGGGGGACGGRRPS